MNADNYKHSDITEKIIEENEKIKLNHKQSASSAV